MRLHLSPNLVDDGAVALRNAVSLFWLAAFFDEEEFAIPRPLSAQILRRSLPRVSAYFQTIESLAKVEIVQFEAVGFRDRLGILPRQARVRQVRYFASPPPCGVLCTTSLRSRQAADVSCVPAALN